MNKITQVLCFALCIFILASCASMNKDIDALNGKANYHLFFDQGDHLKLLIENNRFDEADSLFNEHEYAFFKEKWEKYYDDLKLVADNLNRKYEIELDQAESNIIELNKNWPGPEEKWNEVKQTLSSVSSVLNDYDNSSLLKYNEFRSPVAYKLENSVNELLVKMKDSAKTAFSNYNHLSEKSFFENYPIDLQSKNIINENLKKLCEQLKSANKEELRAFAKNYPASLFNGEDFKTISNTFLQAYIKCDTKDQQLDLNLIVKDFSESKALGFAPTKIHTYKLSFINLETEKPSDNNQIEFLTTMDVDFPIEKSDLDLDEVFLAPQFKNSDIVVLFNINSAMNKRRINNRHNIESRFVAGYRTVPNQEYEIIRNNLNQANMGLLQAQSAPVFDVWADLAKTINVAMWRSQVNDLHQTLNSTPPYLKVPIYQSYNYSVSQVDSKKVLSANYYVLDRINNKYFKSTVNYSAEKSFSVCYEVHKDDPEKNYITNKYNKESDILNFEEIPLIIKASSVIDHILAKQANSTPIPKTNVMRSEIYAEKKKAYMAYSSTKVLQQTSNDPRFESVVAVLNPSNSGLGTGFFVKPDLVLTNYHVVEGSKFVEMKMYDGTETFGKIVKSDLRLDLALVKVQARGKPVTFRDGKPVSRGATVEAIGHPNGLAFSLTRGVVSNFIKSESGLARGGKEVLFIQTDAAINPGNSGGPLFVGNEVVGVNTQKLVSNELEGLGFAVHFSEILAFLNNKF